MKRTAKHIAATCLALIASSLSLPAASDDATTKLIQSAVHDLLEKESFHSQLNEPTNEQSIQKAEPAAEKSDQLRLGSRVPLRMWFPRVPFWHFEDYGMLLNPSDSREQVNRLLTIKTSPWALENSGEKFDDAVTAEKASLDHLLSQVAGDKKDDLLKKLSTNVIMNAIEVNDYVDIPEGGHDVFFLRIRKQFQYYNEDVEPLTFNWARDYTGLKDDFLDFHGAVMLDSYFEPLYNARFKGNRLHTYLRVGAQWDASYNTGNDDQDVRRYYGLVSFWADKLFHLDMKNPQFLQLGYMFEDDVLHDVQNGKFIVSWESRGRLFRSWNENSSIGQFLGFGSRMRYIGNNPFNLLNTEDLKSQGGKAVDDFVHNRSQKPPTADELAQAKKEAEDLANGPAFDYMFFRPNVGIEQLVDQSGQTPNKLSAENFALSFKLKAGITMFNQAAVLGYNLVGLQPVNGGASTAWHHEVRLDFDPSRLGNRATIIEDEDHEIRRHRPSFKTYVAYSYGEQAPSFVHENRLAAGVSIRF